MAIDKCFLVKRHNPVLNSIKKYSPLTVGNGRFAYTADVTGTQTLYETYFKTAPLCVMSGWGWHSFPNAPQRKDLELTEYDFNGRKVVYASECKAGNEAVYHYLRQNPHKMNLARFALTIDGEIISDIDDVKQTLDLWSGILESRFVVRGKEYFTRVACHPNEDTLAFELSEGLSLNVLFPYGSPLTSGADWEAEDKHESYYKDLVIYRKVDDFAYTLNFDKNVSVAQVGKHTFIVDSRSFSVRFATERATPSESTFAVSAAWWSQFWQKGGAIDFSNSTDKRAFELERRAVLSQYLTAINCAGEAPPAETGLTCNSWYGKFHLEMLPYHLGWAPLWKQGELLTGILPWYKKILPKARANAAANSFKGARWPKMTDLSGIDSPSAVATLLIWQQPHIVWLLNLLKREGRDISEYLDVIKETANFMEDFAVLNTKGKYELLPPLIPVQETHRARVAKNPSMELEYWQETLKIAASLVEGGENWLRVAENMSKPAVGNGVYLAHDNCFDTYENHNHDHPSMAFTLGRLKGERVDRQVLRKTLDKVKEVWDNKSLFGWDFGELAMTAARLGDADLAIDFLMADTPKNSFVESGHNYQFGYYQFESNELPIYLPGNGALLMALALMTAGFDGCTEKTPGFPKNGKWEVTFEDILPLP